MMVAKSPERQPPVLLAAFRAVLLELQDESASAQLVPGALPRWAHLQAREQAPWEQFSEQRAR